jgi:acetylornithine deacetylase
MAQINEARYLALLERMIGECAHLQNRPPELIPQESRVADIVEEALKPYLKQNGGPLTLERVGFQPKRDNVIITYAGSGDKYVSFVGSHMDVVPANPDEWKRNPFKLVQEGTKLYGRGTTDCLGHVALITELFIQLAEKKPKLSVNVVAVFIANEENSEIPDVGVDALEKRGYLKNLKNGWMFWVDTADMHPCIGCGTAMSFSITAKGRMGHSAMPHVSINPLILSYEALAELMRKFYKKYPAHPKEPDYFFKISSTMKPTMWSHPPGAINQIPGMATISGDIRLVPFYDPLDVRKDLAQWLEEINANVTTLNPQGPYQSFQTSEARGSVELKWVDEDYIGIACDIKSRGYEALHDATKENLGSVKPFSVGGALPLVYELQKAGFDLQLVGYGVSNVYHGIDEYCDLEDMKKGFTILNRVITLLDGTTGKK